MREPPAAVLLLLLLVAAYAGSLGGGWVWDDNYLMTSEVAWEDPGRFLRMDERSAVALPRSDIYRPLRWITSMPTQALAPGPMSERVASLLLHWGVAWLIAAVGIALGASRSAAWWAAAAFALHPIATEGVAWIQARPELLLAALTLGGLRAFLGGRVLLAGGLLALAPFVKETGVVAVLAAAPLVLAHGGLRSKPAWTTLGIGALGSTAYLALRHSLGVPTPASEIAHADLFGSVGGLAARCLEVLFVPTHAGAYTAFSPAAWVGLVGAGALAGLCIATPRRPALGLVIGAAVLVAPAGLASAANGMFGDRYLYAPVALAAAGLAPTLNALLARRRARALWLVPPLLGAITFGTAATWRDDETLSRTAVERDPSNPYAAFHLAHELHTGQGDCASAVPLYERAVSVEPRAATNLIACLIEIGRPDQGARRGVELTAEGGSASLAFNTARALALQKAWPQAELLTREAIERDAGHVKAMVFLGELLILGQQPAEAERWFDRALALEPNHESARRRRDELRAGPRPKADAVAPIPPPAGSLAPDE